jgi:hypothetical protein
MCTRSPYCLCPKIVAHCVPIIAGPHGQRMANIQHYAPSGNGYYEAGMSPNLQYIRQQPAVDMLNMQYPGYMNGEDNLRAQLAGMYADRGPLHNGMQVTLYPRI